MNVDMLVDWAPLMLLGVLHGINPAMGWLFAVSLGLQEEDRRAVWTSLAPLAAGHALAVAAVVGAAAIAGFVVPSGALQWIVAALLVGLGVAHLLGHRHPRYGGMRVGPRELTIWSFLVASAHGAGLMALPFVPRARAAAAPLLDAAPAAPAMAADPGAHHALIVSNISPGWVPGLIGTVAHTGGYLLVTALVAVIVYEWAGLKLLRSAWINIDLLWAIALIVTGVLTPLL